MLASDHALVVYDQKQANDKRYGPQGGRQRQFRHKTDSAESKERRVNRDPGAHEALDVLFDIVVWLGFGFKNKPDIGCDCCEPYEGKSHHHRLAQPEPDDGAADCRDDKRPLEKNIQRRRDRTMIAFVT